MPPTEAEQLHELHSLVTTVRKEVETKGTKDDAQVERLNKRLDEIEEKTLQPLELARQEAKGRDEKIAELETALSTSSTSSEETKSRIHALELELARAGAGREGADFRESDEYKALTDFVQKGRDEMSLEHKAILRTDVNVQGGFLVPSELDTQIVKKITEFDPIRSIARVRVTAGKALEIPIRNTIPSAEYEGEAEEGGESNATYQATTITPFRQTMTTPATLDLLMNAAFDVDSEMSSDAAEGFAFGEGQHFVSGSGFKRPKGFLTDATLIAGARETAASGELDPESIILLTGDLKVGYDPVYVLNRRTLALIRTKRGDAASVGDAAGQFLWNPGMNGPVSATLNGFPYVLANSMPDVAASAFAIAFGDFRRGYTIVDRTGMSVIRDEVTQKKKGIIEFTWHRWNTGQVTLSEPIKLLKIKA